MQQLTCYLVIMILVIGLGLVAAGCTSGSTTVINNPDANSSASNGEQSTGQELDESDLDGLEDWQKDLLEDEGWNQPYIEPIPGTDVGGAPAEGPESYPGEE